MSTPPNRGHRGAAARAALVTVLGILASALLLAPATPAAAAEPVEDMGCRMVIWTADSVFDTSYDHSGMRHTFRGCMVKRGWATKAYRALKNRQWRLNNHLSISECRVGDYHLSGVKRTTYKGIRVVVFKYRFDYLASALLRAAGPDRRRTDFRRGDRCRGPIRPR